MVVSSLGIAVVIKEIEVVTARPHQYWQNCFVDLHWYAGFRLEQVMDEWPENSWPPAFGEIGMLCRLTFELSGRRRQSRSVDSSTLSTTHPSIRRSCKAQPTLSYTERHSHTSLRTSP